MISAIAFAGEVLGWRLWFVDGGWWRHQHWLDGALWGISIFCGLWGAISAVLFYPRRYGVKAAGVVLFIPHAFSFLLFSYFVVWLKYGAGEPP
jgi:hypothetical protein